MKTERLTHSTIYWYGVSCDFIAGLGTDITSKGNRERHFVTHKCRQMKRKNFKLQQQPHYHFIKHTNSQQFFGEKQFDVSPNCMYIWIRLNVLIEIPINNQMNKINQIFKIKSLFATFFLSFLTQYFIIDLVQTLSNAFLCQTIHIVLLFKTNANIRILFKRPV